MNTAGTVIQKSNSTITLSKTSSGAASGAMMPVSLASLLQSQLLGLRSFAVAFLRQSEPKIR
ncbi:hypothetical protein RBB79_12430 [Tunturiibacter empetritectus]|uniref:Uncharacterized protein n=1 Tax=Tunturiibacter lichenicola TaxID=2051959 RepID=A0A852VFM5_9BACT|nr:hypothetical protein [Edaphobacter lichenicola]NYF90397.1 hypothetical protein [Edaphobacter lichenicola]